MDRLKAQWEQRQQALGNTTRAVLFKNFPEHFNNTLHRDHVRFLLDNLPPHAQTLLDVGCGYGRTAAAIKERYPALEINGVELCEEFARAFATNIGPCFSGSVADYQPARQYDAITIVTLLMYLNREQQLVLLAKLWTCLRPGGRLLLIEPCFNILISLRRLFRSQSLAPTGGEVGYFQRKELAALLATAMPAATLIKTASFSMPLTGFPCLHLGAVLEKPAPAPVAL